MKKILCVLLTFIFVLGLTVSVCAHPSRLADNDGLLSETEASDILSKLDEISTRRDFDVAIATVSDFGGKSAIEYADDLFIDSGYGIGADKDGVLLLLSIEEGRVALSTNGSGKKIFENNNILDSVLDDLSNGNYYDAFSKYIEKCDIYLDPDSETASAHPVRLVDNGNLLSESEAVDILARLDEISTRRDFDVVIVTVSDYGGKTATEYADDFFDYEGYGIGENFDGVLLLLNMNEREVALSACGFGEYAFDDYEYVLDQVKPYLKDGDCYGAFRAYIDTCDRVLDLAEESYEKYGDSPVYFDGKEYVPREAKSLGEKVKDFNVLKSLIISFAIGLIVSLIISGTAKSKLKTVHAQFSAANYVVNGSLNITDGRDTFLYSNITKSPIPESSSGGSGGGPRSFGSGSSSHTSSSGRSHSGGSSHF